MSSTLAGLLTPQRRSFVPCAQRTDTVQCFSPLSTQAPGPVSAAPQHSSDQSAPPPVPPVQATLTSDLTDSCQDTTDNPYFCLLMSVAEGKHSNSLPWRFKARLNPVLLSSSSSVSHSSAPGTLALLIMGCSTVFYFGAPACTVTGPLFFPSSLPSLAFSISL